MVENNNVKVKTEPQWPKASEELESKYKQAEEISKKPKISIHPKEPKEIMERLACIMGEYDNAMQN